MPLQIILTETRSFTLPLLFLAKDFLSRDKCNDFTVLVKSLWCFRLLSDVVQQPSLKQTLSVEKQNAAQIILFKSNTALPGNV